MEQARLIGYELRPGVAASTFLAFTLEAAPGSPRRTTIDSGGKVQSIPGPNEKPQTFETLETDRSPRRMERDAAEAQPVGQFRFLAITHVYLKGTATNLKPGDTLLLVGAERERNLGSDRWDSGV